MMRTEEEIKKRLEEIADYREIQTLSNFAITRLNGIQATLQWVLGESPKPMIEAVNQLAYERDRLAGKVRNSLL